MDTGRTVPGPAIHALLAVCGVGAYLVVADSDVPPGISAVICLAIAASVLTTVRGSGYLPLLVCLVPTTVTLLATAPLGYTWRVPLLMLAVHATARLCWFASQISLSTRVELAVLRADVPRFVVINLIGQATALLAAILTAVTHPDQDPPAPGAAWFAVAGAVALLLLAIALRSGARAWPRRERPPVR